MSEIIKDISLGNDPVSEVFLQLHTFKFNCVLVIMLGTCIMLIRSINISSSNMFLSFIASNFVTESIISAYVIANQFLGSCLMRQMVDLLSKSKYCGFYYRPPTKLREVNVFIRVSLSTGSPM